MKIRILTLLLSLSILAPSLVRADFCNYCDGQWYLGCKAVANFDYDDQADNVNLGFGPGYLFGLCLGYKPPMPLRFEAEMISQQTNIHKFERDDCLKTMNWMANAYFDFELGCALRPYIGFGVGYQFPNEQNASSCFCIEEESWSTNGDFGKSDEGVVAQAMAGINIFLCDEWDIGFEYRYFEGVEKVENHCVGLSIKNYF